ncbi:uncharacterized protein LOC133193222 [Saccostrea echinata]|uniref:uncharacterized protein LOC133193222 n=1 Tax=Saccostrea echinata TaxID=191078 RepID=UPI002A8094B9|nr:uncharacterized protein LOC133193222 [Saccostrea echinata]
MNSYQHLSFNNVDYSYCPLAPLQQSASYVPQSVSKSCDFNCVCCARLHVGNPCSCNTSKTSIGTQTELAVPQGLSSELFWKRGTYEHSIMQKSVHHVVEKYKLDGKKDANWETATTEILTSFAPGLLQTQSNRHKIQHRMRRTIYWTRFYEKKKSPAENGGQKSVYKFLCESRRRKASTQETAALLTNEDDIGADNRGADHTTPIITTPSDDDSSDDSDVPLSTYVKKGKKD